MKLKSALRKIFWVLLDILLILFVIPFGFVMLHYFHLFFTGRNRVELLADLSEYSFKISWVSCAFLFLIALIIRAMIIHRKQWYSVFALLLAGGSTWIVALNFIIGAEFTFWRSILPLFMCCIISTGYVYGKALYNDDSWNFSDEPQLDFHEDKPEEQEEELDGLEESSEAGDESSSNPS